MSRLTPPQKLVFDHLKTCEEPQTATDVATALNMPRIGAARLLQQLEFRKTVLCASGRIPSGPNAREATWKVRYKDARYNSRNA